MVLQLLAMEPIPAEEVRPVIQLVHSIPSVFSTKGTPDDLNFILSHLKQAVCHRGVTAGTRWLIAELLVPLSRFKAGLIDVKQLQRCVTEASLKVVRPDVTQSIQKVSGIPELHKLATMIHFYSRDKAMEDKKLSSPTAGSSAGRRLVYSRDTLLSLRPTHSKHHYPSLSPTISHCTCTSGTKTSALKSLRQITAAFGIAPPTITPPQSPHPLDSWPPLLPPNPSPDAVTLCSDKALPSLTLKTANAPVPLVHSELTPPPTPVDISESSAPPSFTLTTPSFRYPVLKNPPTTTKQSSKFEAEATTPTGEVEAPPSRKWKITPTSPATTKASPSRESPPSKMQLATPTRSVARAPIRTTPTSPTTIKTSLSRESPSKMRLATPTSSPGPHLPSPTKPPLAPRAGGVLPGESRTSGGSWGRVRRGSASRHANPSPPHTTSTSTPPPTTASTPPPSTGTTSPTLRSPSQWSGLGVPENCCHSSIAIRD